MNYNPQKIEKKWQRIWEKTGIFKAKDFSPKPKFYCLDMFPYLSGAGLHVGHPRSYTATDIISRYRRMKGFNVLHPTGWDAFGLPAENYAIKTGIHPEITTRKNIKRFKTQMKSLGLSYDWSREINTTDLDYYKWTQWIFLLLFKRGLAYEAVLPINWCPSCKTGLANEEVISGKCERCGAEVTKKNIRQWVLKITDYAERLLKDLGGLDWPEKIKEMQENWIGRSDGTQISFPLEFAKQDVDRPNFLILHGYTGRADKNFIPWLKNELEKRDFEVQAPQLPNSDNPKESEQVSYVIKNCRIDERTVIVGHSLGGTVAMKVLQQINHPVAGLVLVAPAIEPSFRAGDERPFQKNFTWDFDYEKLKERNGFRIILSDTLEKEKRGSYLEFLADKLSASLHENKAKQIHFTGETEPFILEFLIPFLTVFTTRVDTIFSGTFLILAPEHPLLEKITSPEKKEEVEKYILEASKKNELERTKIEKEKTGVFTGAYAINPANGERMPVWIADFVLAGYGTGAVFADAHDERDFRMAKRYNIPLRVSLRPKDDNLWLKVKNLEVCYEKDGILVNSEQFNGLTSAEAREKITEWLEKKGVGKKTVNYHLRDWIFSRQRYWGEPIPIVHCQKCGVVPLSEKDLPLKLPKVKKYQPTGTGESPLAAIKDWVDTKCPKCGGPAKRETNTMPQWAGSCWYFLRFADPKNKKSLLDSKKAKYWLPVDLYIGGAEHAVLHLLYSRFWIKVLYDAGVIKFQEPFLKLRNQGLVLAPGGQKMSKSRGNVVNPDEIVKQYGADTLRLYEMFMGPFENAIPWDTKGINGCSRFLKRVWNFAIVNAKNKNKKDLHDNLQLLNKLIKKVTEDIENLKFNTAVSAFMEFLNKTEENKEQISKNFIEKFLILLSPFAPHICEELWFQLGNRKSIPEESWPRYDPKLIKEETITLIVQINGKVRDKIEVEADISEEKAKKLTLSREKVKRWIEGKKIKKVVFVSNKLINFVI